MDPALIDPATARWSLTGRVPSDSLHVRVCVQTNAEALGAVHPVGEPAPGEPGGPGPAGQAASLRPPAEADGSRGHATPVLL